LFAARLPTLASLHVERTGMDVADVLSVAARCPNLTELFLRGGADARNAPVKKNASSSSKRRVFENPFESALLHDMPCASPYAAMDALASLLRAGAGRLRSVSLIGAPGAFFSSGVLRRRRRGKRKRKSILGDAFAFGRVRGALRVLEPTKLDAGGRRRVGCSRRAYRAFAPEFAGDVCRRRRRRRAKNGCVDRGRSFGRRSARAYGVRVPRRAAFGAAAATKLDEALAFRAAETDICTEGKKEETLLP
jgi:ribosomal protein S6E (S10)